MNGSIVVTHENGERVTVPAGTQVNALLPGKCAPDGLPYLAVLVNNDVSSLSYPLTVNSRIGFLTAADAHGWRVYRRSLCFLLAKAVRDLHPGAEFRVEHSFGPGLYCSFSAVPGRNGGIAPEQVKAVESHMRELVERDLAIERHKIAYVDAVARFERYQQEEKLDLLRHRNPPRVVLHWCDGFTDLAHGPLAPSTAVLDRFALLPYHPGFVLHVPERHSPRELPPFADQPHLFQIFQEHKLWGRILGVTTVGHLNRIIAENRIQRFILTAEALHEKKVARIADAIAQRREKLKLVLVAGPSSAGKTTFAKRLTVQLTVNGLEPLVISTDDYFVGKDRNPLDENGDPDYEHLEAVDLALFNEHLKTLISGGTVELPSFNFTTKQREYRNRSLRVGDGQILIIEGIHGLNPRLTEQVPAEHKFKVFVSALTQLSVDANNRISTTDNRLMRRIVRDHMYRGHSALDTLRMWPSVRKGEKRWIFPFQREADATFNSALDYELAVLKPRVEPLLMQVKPSDPEYAEARRLSGFLLNFLAVGAEAVPPASILREYIGGSTFEY